MNRLSEETSLYLRQHRDNPVHWQPWDEQALADARSRGAPILLSIGYSACHWCHVMAHESFEDEATAAVMNEHYVNIKVDREERPDLDRVYQLAHQLLTGRGGGWPLTVFLDPESLAPFVAGTYFPPGARHGLPAFRDVVLRVREIWDTQREAIRQQNSELQRAIEATQAGRGKGEPAGHDALAEAAHQALRRHDAEHGGFGGAPKFPQAPLLAALPDLARHAEDDALLQALDHGLRVMALRGLRDPLDGGFYRYCVDGRWTIPHFEKMLYDNAQLLPVYARAAARGRDPLLLDAAEGIVRWMDDEMALPGGGLAASIDADAGGVEGAFHVWTPGEVREVLGEDAEAFMQAFGLDGPPNFEGRHWHLLRDPASAPGAAEPARLEQLQRAIGALRDAREQRVKPTRDDKLLTAWNALAAEGLAVAGGLLGRDAWVDRAATLLDTLHSKLEPGGELHAVYADGRARFTATLDDHASLLMAELALLGERWDADLLARATRRADVLLDRFADTERGGFFMTADGVDAPLARLRPMQDDATPSGNGQAALGLLRLGHLLGEMRYLDAAEGTLRSAAGDIGAYPLAHATLLRALDALHDPPAHLVLCWRDGADPAPFRAVARRHDRVHCYAVGAPQGLPGLLGEYRAEAPVTAFLCRGTSCLPPITDPDALDAQLGAND